MHHELHFLPFDLDRIDGHAAWVSGSAPQLMGYLHENISRSFGPTVLKSRQVILFTVHTH